MNLEGRAIGKMEIVLPDAKIGSHAGIIGNLIYADSRVCVHLFLESKEMRPRPPVR
jgi:hypothetical protein